MRIKRSKKNYFFVLFLIAFFCVSIGYAAMNKTLNITGNSSVLQNTWDLHFENIKVSNGSVASVNVPTLDNDNLSIDFSFNLDLPGDFYEFTVEIHNDGSIDAMIDSVTKTPELTTAQKKYLNYIIEYQNGETIQPKQLIKAGEFVRLKVRSEYRKDLTASDLPTTTQALNLGFTVNYVQGDNTGVVVEKNGIKVTPISNGSLDAIGTVVTIEDQQFYTIGTDGDNVKLLSMYNLYVGNYYAETGSGGLLSSNGYDVKVDNLNYVMSYPVVSKLVPEIPDDPYSLYSISSPTYKQKDTAKGYMSEGYPYIAVTPFSSSSQKGTNYSDYKGSIVESYVNSYKNIMETEYGLDIVEARLITYDELVSDKIRCKSSDNICSGAPSFIYSTSYWIGSPYSTSEVYTVLNTGSILSEDYSYNYHYGVRPVIVISKENIVIEDVKLVADGSLDEVGTVVTIGTEKFYTIGTEGDNVKLFSMYNLNVGNYYYYSEISDFLSFSGYEANVNNLYFKNSDFIITSLVPKIDGVEYGLYPILSPTQKQNVNSKGYTSYGTVAIGVTEFSSSSQKGNNYSDYNGSIVEEYVNNYKNIIETDYGVDIIESRLITYDELTSEQIGCSSSSCASALSFIYSTSYWTGSNYDANKVRIVSKSGSFSNENYDYGEKYGVRPVIVISKSLF